MKNLFEHIENAKGKPHHIKKQIVFGAAGVGAGLIALVWFVGNLSFGTFAIQGSNFADSGERPAADVAGTDASSAAGLAGAAAAISDPKAPAHIEIVDTSPATTSVKKAEPTILPF